MRNQYIEQCVEQFRTILEEQTERCRKMAENRVVTDYKKLDKIIIGVVGGDGIGPIISAEAARVLEFLLKEEVAAGKVEIRNIEGLTIENRMAQHKAIPDDVLAELKKCHVILKGPTTTPHGGTLESANVAMRRELDLYANIRPMQTFKSLLHKSPLRPELVDGADFITIRELTGGMYFGEKYQDNDKAYDTNYYTRPEIERIIRVGYDYARMRQHHLTIVDKANVLASSRLWRQIGQELEKEYPDVKTDYMYVDNASMRMIQEPKFFDVIVTENTFGDILTDESSCISGSMGLLPSASTGDSTPVFEPVHGSWPQAKGLNIANPLAQVLSDAMLFEYFGLKEEGALIRQAVDASIDQNVRTPDIQVEGGAKYGTKEVGEWLVDYIKKA